ncbi:DUF4190 domain-containing protein [Lachnospira multipara]|uniref:DUF4190 domain-containing protein n=1 Tax=Lachnospira multipara TaxID=28051 RepID=UPI0003F8B498|nr:DUF4190 domain-containing protein [Lachnospira multipara]
MAEEMKNEVKKENRHSGFATAALVLGIVGIVLSFIPIINNAAFILGVLAVIFGLVSLIKRASKASAFVGLVLGVAACAITLYMQESVSKALDDAISEMDTAFDDLDGSNTDQLLEKSIKVSFGAFSVDNSAFITSTKLPVTVTNLEAETTSYSIHVEAIDANGSRIGDDYIYVNDLGANQSQVFDCFEYISSDEIASYEAASFKVVEVSRY